MATTPERNLATIMPRSNPDVTMDRLAPLRSGGAKSPTRGIMSCGVTVVAPHMNEMTRKGVKDGVMHRAIHCRPVSVEHAIPSVWGRHQCSCQHDKSNDERPSLDHVTQGQDEDQASSIPSLKQRGDLGGLLIGDIERGGNFVENWLVVVQVCDCEGRRLPLC